MKKILFYTVYIALIVLASYLTKGLAAWKAIVSMALCVLAGMWAAEGARYR